MLEMRWAAARAARAGWAGWVLLALALASCAPLGRFPISPEAGYDDASRLHSGQEPGAVLVVSADPREAERQVQSLLEEALRSGRTISIAGSRHSMGGHTLGRRGQLVVDMLPLAFVSDVSIDPGRPSLPVYTVGAGTRWSQVISSLSKQGYAPRIMQSNNDFTVGGSLSVNCHGWQRNSGPIASTVRSFRIVLADGSVRTCSRTRNAELFQLALGGYGLFGIITEATLEAVPDQLLQPNRKIVRAADYADTFKEMANGSQGLAYGRVCIAPGQDAFLDECILTVLNPAQANSGHGARGRLSSGLAYFQRAVFRSSVGSNRGKALRWRLERKLGQGDSRPKLRSDILDVPSALFGNRNPGFTDILHEYFIPKEELAQFLGKLKSIHRRSQCPDLLNVTIRDVREDRTTFLRYAREDVFGLVLLFNQPRRDPAAERQMRDYTRNLIEAALEGGGSYYLPYRLHATPGQFRRAYPMAEGFFRAKDRFDPGGVFQNKFSERYSTLSHRLGRRQ